MTTPTNSHQQWTDKGGHVTSTEAASSVDAAGGSLNHRATIAG